jgi:UDP-N-acetyl-D-mannosaminuronic acid dehydrogenase
MFLESSNESKSKILTAAMEVDQDYRKYRTILEKQIKSPIVEDNTTRKRYSRQS